MVWGSIRTNLLDWEWTTCRKGAQPQLLYFSIACILSLHLRDTCIYGHLHMKVCSFPTCVCRCRPSFEPLQLYSDACSNDARHTCSNPRLYLFCSCRRHVQCDIYEDGRTCRDHSLLEPKRQLGLHQPANRYVLSGMGLYSYKPP